MAGATAAAVGAPWLLDLLRRSMAGATRALAELSGRPVHVETSAVYLCWPTAAGELVGGAERRVVVDIGLTGSLHGHAALIVSLPEARRLGAILLADLPDEGPDDGADLGELQRSAICEVANVTIGALVGELGRVLGARLRVTVPRLVVDTASAVLRELRSGGPLGPGRAVVAITGFADPRHEIRGTLLVMPDHASYRTLRAALATT